MDFMDKDFAMNIVFYKDDEKISEMSVNISLNHRSFNEVITGFLPEEYKNFYVEKIVGGKGPHQKQIPAEMPLRTAINFWYDCTLISCHIKEKEVFEPQAKSELDQLIANLDGKAYPSHKSERNGKDRLYNKIVNYLILKQATFEYKERKEMKAVPNALLNVLWIIDAHMGEISADTDITSFPDGFCFGQRFASRKQPIIPIKLYKSLRNLKTIRSLRLFKRPEWKTVAKDIDQLVSSLRIYLKKLPRLQQTSIAASISNQSQISSLSETSGIPASISGISSIATSMSTMSDVSMFSNDVGPLNYD